MKTTESWADDAGFEHLAGTRHSRILSLVPSITELLFDLNLGHQVVGRTTFCVHPGDGVDLVPTVGGTKKINFDKAIALRPTHAIVNIDENPKEMAEELRRSKIDVIVTHPIQPLDNVRLYSLFGGIFDRQAEAERLTAEFMTELSHLHTRRGTRHPLDVLYLIWKDPWMTVSRDTYSSRMLSLIEWRTVCHDDQTRYPTIELEPALGQANLVLFASEPYAFKPSDVEQFRKEHSQFAGQAMWVNGEMISWYGSRAIAGLKYLLDLAERPPGSTEKHPR